MEPEESKPVAFSLIWVNQKCTDNLRAQATAVNPNNSSDNVLLTDHPTNRVLLRLDLGALHVLTSATIRSSTASHVEIRSADAAMQRSRAAGDTGVRYAPRERKLFPSAQFCSPLLHRARVQAAQAAADGFMAMTHDQTDDDAASSSLLNNGLHETLHFQNKNRVVDAAQEAVRYVDVDLQGVWEPIQRLSLQRLQFVGYPVSVVDAAQVSGTQVEQHAPSPSSAGPPTLTEEDEQERQAMRDELRRENEKRVQDRRQQLLEQRMAQQSNTTTHSSGTTNSVSAAPHNATCAGGSAMKESGTVRQREQEMEDTRITESTVQTQTKQQLPPAGPPLAGCKIVLSGYQNPLRSQLRDAAARLGAEYSADWNETCTHLICAVASTPKYHEVERSGPQQLFYIVDSGWILACEEQKRRVSEALHKVGSGGTGIAWKQKQLMLKQQKTIAEEENDEDYQQTQVQQHSHAATVPPPATQEQHIVSLARNPAGSESPERKQQKKIVLM